MAPQVVHDSEFYVGAQFARFNCVPQWMGLPAFEHMEAAIQCHVAHHGRRSISIGIDFSLAEDWRRAFDYLLRAAEKAAAAFALRDALALYDQALAVADHLGDALPAAARMAIHQAKSTHAFFVGDFNQGRAEGERPQSMAPDRRDALLR